MDPADVPTVRPTARASMPHSVSNALSAPTVQAKPRTPPPPNTSARRRCSSVVADRSGFVTGSRTGGTHASRFPSVVGSGRSQLRPWPCRGALTGGTAAASVWAIRAARLRRSAADVDLAELGLRPAGAALADAALAGAAFAAVPVAALAGVALAGAFRTLPPWSVRSALPPRAPAGGRVPLWPAIDDRAGLDRGDEFGQRFLDQDGQRVDVTHRVTVGVEAVEDVAVVGRQIRSRRPGHRPAARSGTSPASRLRPRTAGTAVRERW